MTNEMDWMGLEGRRRLAWLLANRATLFAVGLVWIGMIVAELLRQRAPWFLLAMVPIFAALRAGFYLYFARRR